MGSYVRRGLRAACGVLCKGETEGIVGSYVRRGLPPGSCPALVPAMTFCHVMSCDVCDGL